MDQSRLIVFEQGMDNFMAMIKSSLGKQEHAHFSHQSMPQCLQCLKVTDQRQQELVLRLVLIGCTPTTTLARLSWLDETGQDHVCCYMNSDFEVVKRKANGKWVLDKHTPEAMCLKKWSHLHSPVPEYDHH